MGALSSIGDTFYALRFLRLLTMPWEKTAAFKEGLIDKDGNQLQKAETSAQKSAYTLFHRMVFNIRRMFKSLPGGVARKVGTYAAALFLIREYYELGPTFETIVESRLNLLEKTQGFTTVLECVFDESAIVGECLGMTVTHEMIEDVGVGAMSVGSFTPALDKRIVGVASKTFRKVRTGQNVNWRKRIKDEKELSNITRAMESTSGGIILQCNDTGAMIAVKNVLG